MIEYPPGLRPATVEDAPAMAELVNMAGEGLPLYLWTVLARPGETPWDVGRSRARRETGGFSYRNTTVLETDGAVGGCLIGYPLDDEPQQVDYDEMPAMFVPLQQLEDAVPGTWYVNVLAVYPHCRGRGHATRLLGFAERLAVESGKRGMSIIVSDANAGARRLYERCGYREAGSRPMVKEGWPHPGSAWVLLVKDLPSAA